MLKMFCGLILALALIGCGHMQIQNQSDFWDYAFVGIVLLIVALIVGDGRDWV